MDKKPPHDVKANTGETCPRSGVWQVLGKPEATARMDAGDIVPPYQGRAVAWRLVTPG